MNNIYRQYDILIKNMVTILSEKYKFDKEEALEHLGFEKEYPQNDTIIGDNIKPKTISDKQSKKVNEDPDIARINERIKNEICYNTLSALSDEKLLPVYRESKSVKEAIKILENTLDEFVDLETKQKIVNKYLLQLIPAGTKGVYRGNTFNKIIKAFILNLNLNLNSDRFKIEFEKKCESHFTSEFPDWYVLEKATNKIIIGMNQLDLWGGGQQTNRGSKYIEGNKHNNEKSKLVCVVCNEIEISSKKNKTYKLFEIGFTPLHN
jgi:hypothetical protein